MAQIPNKPVINLFTGFGFIGQVVIPFSKHGKF